ncbi:hypothetical protein PG991_002002 [Apiospora marii]|uniref:Uncharacterized protein n=2 Tax=Apiospora marii TaxID=335849 RepID=A0ABR1SQE2_9PEZI
MGPVARGSFRVVGLRISLPVAPLLGAALVFASLVGFLLFGGSLLSAPPFVPASFMVGLFFSSPLSGGFPSSPLLLSLLMLLFTLLMRLLLLRVFASAISGSVIPAGMISARVVIPGVLKRNTAVLSLPSAALGDQLRLRRSAIATRPAMPVAMLSAAALAALALRRTGRAVAVAAGAATVTAVRGLAFIVCGEEVSNRHRNV